MSPDVTRPPLRLTAVVLVWALLAAVGVTWAIDQELELRGEARIHAEGERTAARLANEASRALALALSLHDAELTAEVAQALVDNESELDGIQVIDLDHNTTVAGTLDQAPHQRHASVRVPDAPDELLLTGDRLPPGSLQPHRDVGTIDVHVTPNADAVSGSLSPEFAMMLIAIALGSLGLALWIRHRLRSLTKVAVSIGSGQFGPPAKVRGKDEIAWASRALGDLSSLLAEQVDRVQDKNADLQRDVSRKEDRLGRIRDFASTLVAPIGEAAQLDLALGTLGEQTEAAFAVLFTTAVDDAGRLQPEAVAGVSGGVDDPRLEGSWSTLELSADELTQVCVHPTLQPVNPLMRAAGRQVPLDGVAVVPLRFRDRLEGVIVLARRSLWNDEELSFLSDATQPLSIALANRRAYEATVAMTKALEGRNDELAKQRDKLQEVDRLRGRFVANMSHELRTPLNAIIGYTELVADGAYGKIAGEQQEPLQNVLDASQNLLTLVNQVLDLSRAEADSLELDAGPCDVRKIADEVARLTQGLCRERPYNPKVMGPNCMITTDAGRVQQILVNLVGNAIKFTAEGSVSLQVVPSVDGGVQVVVQDTGIGIDPAHMELIFEEFRQADDSSTRAYDGVGLGLAISRRFARALGGSLTVTSNPGRGSRFVLALPRTAPTLAAPVARAS